MMKKIVLVLIIEMFSVCTTNAQWTAVCSSGNGFVDNFENFNGELFATGFFNTLCGVSCNYVAKYNGSTWQAAGNGLPNAGHHLSAIDSSLYGVAYQPQKDSNWVYKYDGTNFNPIGEGVYLSNAVVGFSQTANLYNIIKYNEKIVACGEFDRVGTRHISGIMQWDGSQWSSLGTGLSGNIVGTAPVMYPHDMCIFGTDLIVAGNFKNAGGQVVNGVARWDGTQWHSIGQGFNSTVYAIGVFNGELYAGGDFTMTGGNTINYIAKWDGTNWVNTGFSFFYNNPLDYTFIHTLKVLNHNLLIGGGFDRIVLGADTLQSSGIAAFDGANINVLNGGFVGKQVEAIAIYDQFLIAGGGANNSNSYIASYNLPTLVKTSGASSNIVTIFPNPTTEMITILSSENSAEFTITTILGQPIKKSSMTTNKIDVQMEENGIYIISVKTNTGTTNHKIVVNR